MAKETTIKVSRKFKQFIFDKKEQGEDFEATMIRLMNNSIPNSIPQYKKKILKSQTDFVFEKESNNKDYSIQENEHGDKAMMFNDGKIVIIPRVKILMKMLENFKHQAIVH